MIERPSGAHRKVSAPAIQLEILGVVDHTHAAGAQHANDAVMEDGAADHRGLGILGNAPPTVNELAG